MKKRDGHTTLVAGISASSDTLTFYLCDVRRPALFTATRCAVRPAGVAHRHEAGRLFADWVEVLSDREREVLQGRFGLHDSEPEKLEVLSKRLDMTRERVHQMQNEATSKLKRHRARNGISKEALF